jgi:hypothetical protein
MLLPGHVWPQLVRQHPVKIALLKEVRLGEVEVVHELGGVGALVIQAQPGPHDDQHVGGQAQRRQQRLCALRGGRQLRLQGMRCSAAVLWCTMSELLHCMHKNVYVLHKEHQCSLSVGGC